MDNKEYLKMEDLHRKPTRIGAGIPPVDVIVPMLEAYSIKKEIGRGGMAVVYEAVEKSLNRVVALKVLNKELSQDSELIHRFVNEAQAAAGLSHTNIVQIYSIGQEKDVYYFAMEYVRGRSVDDMLSFGKKIPLVQCINIVRQTVHALHEAYKNNIVHRDIKPGNLLVTEQGVVKVADFGLAAEIRGAPTAVGGKIIGTPLYISPEQAQGKGGDCRSDIYSLGITFYQMLSGEVPFISSDTKILMKYHMEKPLPQLSKDIPSEVRKMIFRMTAKNPEERYENYESLARELDQINRLLTSRRYILPVLSLGLLLSAGITMYSFHYKPMVGDILLPPLFTKDKQIENIYNNVVRYARKNPEAYVDIIKEYFRIMKEYPNTEWAYRAEQKIDIIVMTRAKEASLDLKELKPVADKFINEKRYKEAIDSYKGIKDKYKDTAAESFAQENINYIMEVVRKDFNKREEQSREYLDQYRFNDARKLYTEVIDSFGLSEFMKIAQERLHFIDELESRNKIESEAKRVFIPLEKEVEKFLAGHNYDDARQALKNADKTKGNTMLSELVNKELGKIDEMEIEYESAVLKQRVEKQYNLYNETTKKAEDLINNYEYKEAITVVKEGIFNLGISEWHSKLEVLQEKLQYLILFKDTVITGINKELKDRNIANISAGEDTIIFIVEGGYVGARWNEPSAQKIYQVAQRYIEDNSQGHMILGVFCLTSKLKDYARREFTLVLRMDLKMQAVVEKYLIQLTEAGNTEGL